LIVLYGYSSNRLVRAIDPKIESISATESWRGNRLAIELKANNIAELIEANEPSGGCMPPRYVVTLIVSAVKADPAPDSGGLA
jgi:hypothetical protein